MKLRNLSAFLILALPLDLFAQKPPERLSRNINSEQSELAPVISSDGKTLYFARPRYGLDSSIVVDIWRSVQGEASGFGPAEIIGGSLSSRYGIAVTSVAPDNNSLYLMGKMQENTPPEDRIYVSHRTKDGWSEPRSIHIDSLRVRGTFTDYSFGPDQKTLVMSVERDSTMGQRDLYVSFLDEPRNRWTEPLWLGSKINSPYSEMTPFLATDNRTLYFSSDRPNGYGDVDVYRSVRLDDSWKNWSIPENLGPSINHPGRTLYYTEDARGEYAYFVWRPNINEQTDIFRAHVAKQKANVVALVHGHVLDNEGHPVAARIRYERLSDGKELGSARSDPATGDYQLTLPAGALYGIRAQKQGFAPTSEHIDLSDLKEFEAIERNLVLTAIKKGALVRLNSIFFETDKATLLPPSFPELDHLKTMLDQDPKMKISIEGHTDSVGSKEHNLILSKGRAQAVQEYLLKAGVDKGRLSTAAFGPTKPLATNDTEEGRSQNRRVEFRVLESSAPQPTPDESQD